MAAPSALLLGALLARVAAGDVGTPQGTIVAVGSGGCDGQDSKCDDASAGKKAAEKVIKLMTVTDDGALHNWTELSDLPGQAAWFARGDTGNSKNCLFVTYPGISSIGAFQWSANDVPKALSTIPVTDSSIGANPVFGDISADGNTLVVANYHGPDDQTNSTGASVETFSISDGCKLTHADLKPHSGSSEGGQPERQSAAHPHSTVVGRNNMLFVCDLGMDIIFTYSMSSSGKLTELSRYKTKPGSGPRHSMMHPTKPHLFVVSEMGSTISSYDVGSSGKLTLIDEMTTLPTIAPSSGSKCAELAITPDGRHVYASNRAFDPNFMSTIAQFDIDDDGKLTAGPQTESPPFPRGMTLMPDGKFLLAASQTTGEVASFQVDAQTGHLTPTGSSQEGPWGAAAFAILSKPSVTAPIPALKKKSLVV